MLFPKPTSITRVGIIQFFLALSFVIWLVFFPSTGDKFAWPIAPAESARFIGASFALRTFFGYHLWRQKDWMRLRWSRWGNFAFLTILFLATFWHIDEMNWKANIVVAHIWVLAYTAEPLVLLLVEPHSSESEAKVPANLSEGPILPGLQEIGLTAREILSPFPGVCKISPGSPLEQFCGSTRLKGFPFQQSLAPEVSEHTGIYLKSLNLLTRLLSLNL